MATNFAQVRDEQQISRVKKVTSEATKEERIKRRADRLAENDAYEKSEGLLYEPGIDD